MANAKSLISVDALKKVADDAQAATVVLTPRARIATPSPATRQPEDEEEEKDELSELEAHEKLIARFLSTRVLLNWSP